MTSNLPPESDVAYQRNVYMAPKTAEESLLQTAAVRKEYSIEELGNLAGVGIIDEYRMARAETNIRWWKDPALAVSALYGLLGLAVPLAGFGAGIAIDFAVFGGTAKDLAQASKYFEALSVGSLVFAVGIGLAKEHRKILIPLMFVASIGASLIAADNPAFRGHFANWMPFLKGAEVTATDNLGRLQGKINELEKLKADDLNIIEHGGAGGKNMLKDQIKENDITAYKYYGAADAIDRKLPELQSQLGVAQKEQVRSTQENTAQYYGRMMGALYIFSWLAASQLVIAKVIEMGAGLLKDQKEKSAGLEVKRQFVRDMESLRGRGMITAAISSTLMHFNQILSMTAEGKEGRQENIQRLFGKDGFAKMQEIGTDLAFKTIAPRSSWKATMIDLFRDRFNRGPGDDGAGPMRPVAPQMQSQVEPELQPA